MHAALLELQQRLLCSNSLADQEMVVATFLHQVIQHTGAGAAFLHLWDEEIQEYLPLQIVATALESHSLRRPLQHMIHSAVHRSGFLEKPATDTLVLDAVKHTVSILPLGAAEQPLGLLGMLQPVATFAALAILRQEASLVVAAIRQMRRSQELERQNRELTRTRARLESTLQAFEHRQATIEALSFKFAGDAILTVDIAGHISSWNKGAERVYGYSREEIMGQPLYLLYPVTARHEDPYAHLFPGHVATDMEVVRQTRQGQELVVNLTTSPITNGFGQIVGGCEISRDVTRQKQLERQIQQQNKELITHKNELEATLERLRDTQSQLIHSEKMAAIGVLLAGLSHELNNPVSIILGYAQSLLKRFPPEDAKRQALLAIERQAQRCSHLVKSLLDFCRKKPLEKECVAANVILQRLGDLLKGQARRQDVHVVCFPAEANGPLLDVCLTEIESALLNLLNNALDATPSGGSVTLQAYADEHAGQPGFTIAVRDTGCGIPTEIMPQILNPFFTTKPPGKGTGLGLSLTQQIVEAHEGQLHIESTIGKGTTVRLWFPAAAPGLRKGDTRS